VSLEDGGPGEAVGPGAAQSGEEAAERTLMKDWALTYAGRAGWPVLPVHPIRNGACGCGSPSCKRPGKHPIGTLVRNGFKDATTDEATVERWFTECPDANIGIPTGSVSGLIVLDVDGEEGEKLLAEFNAESGPLPEDCCAMSGRGRHIYLRYLGPPIQSLTNGTLDLLGDKSYVVAPPSMHESGRRYTWVSATTVPQITCELAQDLRAFIQRRLHQPSAKPEGPTRDDGLKPPPWTDAEEKRVRSALTAIPADNRGIWFKVGAALHWTGWPSARKIWDDWSKSAPDIFDEADQDKTWKSFDRGYDGPLIKLGTLYRIAHQHGWQGDPGSDKGSPGALYQTDLGNARRLVARHGDNIRCVHPSRSWIIWDGEGWHVDDKGKIDELAKDTVEAIFAEAEKVPSESKRKNLRQHALKSQSFNRLKAMVRLAESDPKIVLSPDALDANPWLLGVRNGVIELRTGLFRPARRDDYVTRRAGVAFDPTQECPIWREFLDVITGGDRDPIAYMQRACGYLLTGLVREEVMFVLWGTGRNGKSTFRETLHALMGDYAIVADAGLLMTRQTAGGATPEVARLYGRRLVAINETARNDRLNEARVKFLTSNDKITARNLYKELFDFTPTHKTFLTTNHKPIVQGTDEGIWRRIHLWPFIVKIPEEKVEKDFRERRLIPELPGILNWALEGLAAYHQAKLNPPACVRAATMEYREDMDLVGQWLEERCERDDGARVPTGQLHADYTGWALGKIRWTLSVFQFGRDLADRGFGDKKGAGGRRMTRGLRLKPTAGPFSRPA
jgi:putative DNA primase/helicase